MTARAKLNTGIQYDRIAKWYDLLAEGDDGKIYFRLHARELLNRQGKQAYILDCSCGTGDHAIWMAGLGYRVDASDISQKMLGIARQKAAAEKLNIRFFRSSWEELQHKAKKKYTLVVSPGNSFSHLQGSEMLQASVSSIWNVMQQGGHFMFDIRNWEKTIAENSLQEQSFHISEGGMCSKVCYAWDNRGLNKPGKMFVSISRGEDGEVERYDFDFLPVTYGQLRSALEKTGFGHIRRDFYPGRDHYCLTAQKI
jgi:2-polyprenyl-3-methyl-5-hydroxy-6-metoxy-1,4-benzoquinol methylase